MKSTLTKSICLAIQGTSLFLLSGASGPDSDKIHWALDFAKGFESVGSSRHEPLGKGSPIRRERDGFYYPVFSEGQKLSYSLDGLAWPLESGCLQFEYQRVPSTSADSTKPQPLLFLKSKVTEEGTLIIQYQPSLSVIEAIPATVKPAKTLVKGLQVSGPVGTGEKIKVALYWKREGDKAQWVLEAGGKYLEKSAPADTIRSYSQIFIGSTSYSEGSVSEAHAVGNISLRESAFTRKEVPGYENPAASNNTPETAIARIQSPLGMVAAGVDDRDPIYGFDGLLATSYLFPKGKGKSFVVDLGTSNLIFGWKIACSFSEGYGKPIRENADGRLYKSVEPYQVEISPDGSSWILAGSANANDKAFLGEYQGQLFPEPLVARFVRFTQNGELGFSLIGDLRILSDQRDAEVPSFEKAKMLNRILAEGRDLELRLDYIRKAASYLESEAFPGISESERTTSEKTRKGIGELTTEIKKLANASNRQIESLYSRYRDFESAVSNLYIRINCLLHASVEPKLREEAKSKLRQMEKNSFPEKTFSDLTALVGKSDSVSISRFDSILKTINESYQKQAASKGWAVRRQGRFLMKPDGERLTPFGLNYMGPQFCEPGVEGVVTLPLPRRRLPVAEEDFRNMKLFGLNTIRLPIGPTYLELRIQNGKRISINEAHLALAKRCLELAYKYGIYVIVDFHKTLPPQSLPYSKYGIVGPTSSMGPYLSIVWDELSKLCASYPNIVAYELVANEANIRGGFSDAMENPYRDEYHDSLAVRDYWNDWLKKKYTTRKSLDSAWSDTVYFSKENSLRESESWDSRSILLPTQLRSGKDGIDYKYNTRLYDYFLCGAEHYSNLVAKLSDVIKSNDPVHLIALEENHDLQFEDGVPTDGRWFTDILPPSVSLMSDHYDELMASKFPATGFPWYAGEMWIVPGKANLLSKFLARGGGIIGWTYNPSGTPHSRFIEMDRWRADAWAHWTASADFFNLARGYEAAPIAVVYSSMSPKSGHSGFGNFLEEMDLSWDLVSSLQIQKSPDVLTNYKAVLVSLDRNDPETIRLILSNARTPALFFGRQNGESSGKWGSGTRKSLEKYFFKEDHGKSTIPSVKTEVAPSLWLEGDWYFKTDPNNGGLGQGFADRVDFSSWDRISIPGKWEREEFKQGEYMRYDGIAWCVRKVSIPKEWSGRDLVFTAGAIDDYDICYFNGEKIGSTDLSTSQSWNAPRRYRIPSSLINFGGENRLAIWIHDEKGDGGITRGPVEIGLWVNRENEIRFASDFGYFKSGETGRVDVYEDLPQVAQSELASGVESLAVFESLQGRPALLRKDQFYCYVGGNGLSLNAKNETEAKLLASFLSTSGLKTVYPATAESMALNVRRLDNMIFVENVSAKTMKVDLESLANKKIAWCRVIAPPYRKETKDFRAVEIPSGAFVGAVYAP